MIQWRVSVMERLERRGAGMGEILYAGDAAWLPRPFGLSGSRARGLSAACSKETTCSVVRRRLECWTGVAMLMLSFLL